MNTVQKQCNECLQELPATLEYFHADPKRPFGLYDCCKACKNRRARARYARAEVRKQESERKKTFYASEHGRDLSRASWLRRRQA